jgi:DNA processing protein
MKRTDAAWVALSLLPHVGNKTLSKLIDSFGDAEAVLAADLPSLLEVKGIGRKIAESILAIRLDETERQISQWEKAAVQILPYYSPDYPQALRDIPDAPPSLFLRGSLQDWEKSAAIVGTRKPSQAGAYLARKLAKNLSEAGYWIVSGLALGIDAIAHDAAMDRTIAVLGGGVLNIYPPENQNLAQNILKEGAILSENHPLAASSAPRLVFRNRLISAFAQHVIVVETASDGGAMHAARAAITQGRKLYTFDIKEASGNQQLLAENATALDFACLPF